MVAEVPAPKEKMDDDQTSAIRQESMDVLDGPRRQIFSRAIARILHTEEAEVTYAQIVDGLPLCDVANDRKVPGLRLGHPMEQHKEFCPGVLAQTRLFRETFDPDTLKFDARVSDISGSGSTALSLIQGSYYSHFKLPPQAPELSMQYLLN
jgi:hypothetical protein